MFGGLRFQNVDVPFFMILFVEKDEIIMNKIGEIQI